MAAMSRAARAALLGVLLWPAAALAQSLDEREFATLLGQAGQAYEEGRYPEAETLTQGALLVAMRFGPGDLRVGLAQRNLALVYRLQARFAEAEERIRAARVIFDAVRGPDHPETAAIVNILATVREDRGYFREAEGLYRQALAIREKYLGPDSPDLAWSLNNLGLNYRSQRRYAEAEPLLVRALGIWERALGPEHPRVATTLDNLGTLHRLRGKLTQAEPELRQAAGIWERLGHPSQAVSLNSVAALLIDQ